MSIAVESSYRSNILLKRCNVEVNYNEHELSEYIKCKNDPVYFLENYFKIVNLDKGLIPIKLYDFQKDIIKLYHENKFCILKLPRQSSKTTTTVGYILWASLFNDSYVIAILANKGSLAREILDRYQTAYEQLPFYLQQGVVAFNKGSVELENGSKILAASTSSSAIRGYSINLLYCLEGETSKIKIRNKQTLLEEEISLKDYFKILNKTNNQTSVGQLYLENTEYEIFTPQGWENFSGIFANFNVNKQAKKLCFSDGNSITATLDHRFFINKKEIRVSEITVGDIIDSTEKENRVINIESVILKDTYEIFNAENHKIIVNGVISHQCDEFAFIHNNLADEFFTSVFPTISSGKNTKFIMSSTPKGMNLFYKFWTDAKAGRNGFAPYEIHWSQVPGRDQEWYEQTIKAVGQQKFDQEYNCHFLGSTNTLISGEKLATLAYKEPINKFSDMVIYEEPIKESYDDETGRQLTKDHLYAITVDVSEGKNLDYSVFSVFDVSVMPYRQVAIYRNNVIPPVLFPNIIKTCAEYYNNAFVLIEINNSPQVAHILQEDLEYENVLKIASGNKKAQTLSMGLGKGIAMGLRMSPLVKRQGCSMLKTLIENDKLVINDFETISELTTFVQEGPSYRAEEGCNDDLAMSLVIFSWLVTEKLFKDIVDHDIRMQLQLEHFEYVEAEMLPVGEISTGLEIEHFVEDGAVWIETNNQDVYSKTIKDLLDYG